MEKAKKIIFVSLLVAILIIAGLYGFYLYKSKPVSEINQNILFYRYDCPHCKIVDEFVTANNITDKIEFEHLEISKPFNTELILEVAKICKINQAELGVPLYYEAQEEKCYLGDQPIIDYFKLKLDLD